MNTMNVYKVSGTREHQEYFNEYTVVSFENYYLASDMAAATRMAAEEYLGAKILKAEEVLSNVRVPRVNS